VLLYTRYMHVGFRSLSIHEVSKVHGCFDNFPYGIQGKSDRTTVVQIVCMFLILEVRRVIIIII